MPESENTEPKHSRFGGTWTSARSTRVILATATVLALLSVGYWFVKEAADTLSHISPGRSLSRSSSMEPYELSFRLASKSGVVNEWNLAVPRAFVVDETGQNGAVAPWTGTNTGYFSASIVLLQAGNGQFVPEAFVAEGDRSRHAKMKRIVVFLGNTDTERWIYKNDICVPQHQLGDVARQYGSKERNSPCLEQSNACTISTQLNGWAIGIGATKDLYANPQFVCATVKSFLNAHTTHRDRIEPRS
jgi:hypothetical protein